MKPIIFAVLMAAALELPVSEIEAAGSQFINDLKQGQNENS